MTAASAHSAGGMAVRARRTNGASECTPPARTGAMRRTTRGYASGRDDYLTRLRKVEGQIRGLQRMIEADTWCPDVVTQVASATRALQEVAVGLLSDHLRHCVAAAVRNPGTDSDEAFDEVAGSIRQVIRL
jgi:DNA-binding FrmR family transcriptional regulator